MLLGNVKYIRNSHSQAVDDEVQRGECAEGPHALLLLTK